MISLSTYSLIHPFKTCNLNSFHLRAWRCEFEFHFPPNLIGGFGQENSPLWATCETKTSLPRLVVFTSAEASEREVERGSPWPPRFRPSLSSAALSGFCFSPRIPQNKAPSCPRRGPWVHVNRRGPYLESFAIFTKLKTSMQAAGDPERGGSVAPCHASSSGSRGSPMAGQDLSAPRGSSGGDDGWRRRPGRARTWKRRLLPPSGRRLRVHPRAGPLMGAGVGKTQWRGGRAGCEGREACFSWKQFSRSFRLYATRKCLR